MLPPGLRALGRLVTVLLVVMIAGFLVLIAALVMRLNADGPPLPDTLALPEGAEAVAFTQGADWYAVVTRNDASRNDDGGDRILIYDRLTGRLRQEITVDAGGTDAPARTGDP